MTRLKLIEICLDDIRTGRIPSKRYLREKLDGIVADGYLERKRADEILQAVLEQSPGLPDEVCSNPQ